MVSNIRPPRAGTITDLVNGLLDKGYNRAAQPVLNAIARGTTANSGLIQQRLRELEAEAARLDAAGERLQPGNPILRALLADLETELRRDAGRMNNAAAGVQDTAINAAGKVQRQLALPGVTNAQLAKIGIGWNVPDPAAVAQLVDYASGQAWASMLQKYGSDVLGIVNNQAIRGITLGWSPLRTAREIRKMVENIPAHQANNLMRTLQLTSYRDASAMHQQANLDICEQIIRIAALDARTCLSCVSRHGSVIWDSERDVGAPVPRVDDHHSGRCTSVMQVKGRPPLNIQSGDQWFAGLSEERQRQQASFQNSPGKWEAFKAGQVTLRDFSEVYTDPTFGPMLREASLTGALQNNTVFTSVPAAPRRVPTLNGYLDADVGAPGETVESLNAFLNSSNGPLAQQIKDLEMNLTDIDFFSDERTVNVDNVKLAAKRFVAESQNIEYGKDYLLGLVQEMAADNGVVVSGDEVEQLYNSHYANQAQAILTTARIGNVRLTEAQIRRLTKAAAGNYASIVYTTESSLRGSLQNAINTGRGAGMTGTAAAKKAAREEFLDRLGRLR